MPKIFLIKNRLQRLLESENGGTHKNEILDDAQPLSLTVHKEGKIRQERSLSLVTHLMRLNGYYRGTVGGMSNHQIGHLVTGR
ncbi:hypothetical protein Zmor_010014 [Zophobas morio]|uniref:Uncharacterized protein n=1 Tax=Zophobas morio TaxID=2755281 RepID=A0AA38IN53_9CUCU|nr:hypothetical protein Zmor_010014 [Zophobas morio]